jgi:hypothetical protein
VKGSERASDEWPLLFPWADNDATKIDKGGNACVCGWEFQWALHPSVFFHSSPCFCCWLSDASSQHGDDGRHSMSPPPNGHQLSSDAFFVYHHLNIWPLADGCMVRFHGWTCNGINNTVVASVFVITPPCSLLASTWDNRPSGLRLS